MMTPSLQTSMNSAASLRDELISYGNEGLLQELMAEVPPERIIQVLHAWLAWAHEHQRPPLVASGGADWNTWLILGGRGAGKTRAGAEWVRGVALGVPGFSEQPLMRIALVGETEHDVREVMIEGVSGILAVHAAARAAGMDPVAAAARMEERRGRGSVLRRRPGKPARPAIRRRLGRRDRQVAPCRSNL